MRHVLRNFCSFSTNYYRPNPFDLSLNSAQQQACILANYISYFRKHGHHYSKFDPLNIYNKNYDKFLKPADVGIKNEDQISSFKYQNSPIVKSSSNISEVEQKLVKSYLQYISVQFQHVDTIEQKEWLYQNYEKLILSEISKQKQLKIAKTLVQAEALDHFLHTKFVTFKRYSGQGAQSTVVSLAQLFQLGAENGYSDIVFGMPHRGRMNTLVNVLDYPASILFRKISGKTMTPQELHTVIDDVVSHTTQSVQKQYNGNKTKITMVHNPSHLEAQNPVSMGKARSKMIQHGGQDKVLNIQVHGDAAICAQGVVYQSFLLGRVPKYAINGTIHIITNNQLGYTTNPIDSRSTRHPSDVCKGFNIPIIHVNSQSIEDVVKAMQLCVMYRKKYKKDILVDLICYRKYGHNEVDQPRFTQPKMYGKIDKGYQPNTKSYAEKLEKLGLGENLYASFKSEKEKLYKEQFQLLKNLKDFTLSEYTDSKSKGPRAFTHQWKGFKPTLHGSQYPTGFDVEKLKQFAHASVTLPSTFSVHSRIKRYHIDERIKSITENKLNWATCEALAFFSLNFEGYNVRFTGQDVQRGTFSQRHINLTDQKTQQEHNPLQFFSKQSPNRGKVQFYNSPLTQNAAMSYQYGFSLDNPQNFVCWQAQFGDFFNTAQVVIDTFLTNSESKWMRQTGLTLILPHGYDGAGPEHSSCRIQRFLQLANSDGGIRYYRQEKDVNKRFGINETAFQEDFKTANFSLVVPSKPSNIFHVLRRQMKRNFRSPLVIAGPKKLLRHPSCNSTFQELGPDSKFEQIIHYSNKNNVNDSKVVIFCSGQIAYDIQSQIDSSKSSASLYTIEELFPFPEEKVKQILKGVNKDAQVYWVQQQNLNSGAFYFVEPRLNRVINELKLNNQLKYVGRRAISACAVGSSELHKKQGDALTKWISEIIL